MYGAHFVRIILVAVALTLVGCSAGTSEVTTQAIAVTAEPSTTVQASTSTTRPATTTTFFATSEECINYISGLAGTFLGSEASTLELTMTMFEAGIETEQSLTDQFGDNANRAPLKVEQFQDKYGSAPDWMAPLLGELQVVAEYQKDGWTWAERAMRYEDVREDAFSKAYEAFFEAEDAFSEVDFKEFTDRCG